MPTPPRTVWRHWWIVGLVMLALVVSAIGAIIWYAGTPQFENRVREEVISVLERVTGGRVELGSFHWRLLHLQFEANNLTIHGLEAQGEAPYAHAQRVVVRVKIMAFFRERIGLSYLGVDRPAIHLIVYPDGSTNQPHPKVASTSNASITDTIFDLQVNRAELNDGVALINQQSIPFNITANNLGATLRYIPPVLNQPARYDGAIHVEDLTAQRGIASAIHSSLDLQAQLLRNSVSVPLFRLRSGGDSLEGSASLENFAHPQWKTSVTGSVDARMAVALAPIPGLDRGKVQLQLTGQGTATSLTVDGQATVTDGAYHSGTIHLDGVNAKTAIHLTENEIALTNAHAGFTRGGAVDGSLRILNWATVASPPPAKPARRTSMALKASPSAPQQQGIIRARISGMTLSTIMSFVAPADDRQLGFATVAEGPVNLDWRGNADNFVMDARIALTAPREHSSSEIPLNGSVDGQYVNNSGMVNIRNLTASTPASQIQVSGALGVYPPTRASKMQVSVTTDNLGEFDRTLTTLGLSSEGKTGVKAIPVALHGEAAFHGTIGRSILAPDVKGHLTATNFDLIYTSAPEQPSQHLHPTQPAVEAVTEPAGHTTEPAVHTLHWDSLQADAEYSPELISVSQASLVRGPATVHLSGELHAHQVARHGLTFDEDSAIQVNATIHNGPVGDILQLAGQSLPVTGSLNVEIQASGQLDNLSGGGHLDLQGGEVYGEPYRSLNTDVRFIGREIDASNLVFLLDGGKVQGNGAYNLTTGVMRFSAQGTGFDLAHVHRLQTEEYPLAGFFAFEAHGDGTLKDPIIEANLHLSHLNLADKAGGNIDVTAHTQNDVLFTDLNARMTNAVFQIHGQTQLSGDYQSTARLMLSSLDVDPILRTFDVHGITAHSTIVGTFNFSGPLRYPRRLSGDAVVDQFALSLAGVPLHTEGPLHATLANGRLHLDLVHIVGDDTNLHAQGSVGVLDNSRSLDLHGNGSINMKLAQTLDTDLTSSGHVDFNVDAAGTFAHPSLTGQVRFTNVAVALQDFPNGLSQMNGTLQFDQDRLDVKSLTAVSGGGKLQLGGFITYHLGLYADLTANAKDVRIRYPQGISSMADAQLRLQGTQSSLLLGGNITITRFVIGSDLDLASLTGSSMAVTLPPNPNAPSNRFRLDIHIVSAPQLDFQNSYAKLAGDVDLRLRGTLAQPSLLGHIAITEGSATFAGTKYELQRGDIYFTNPVRIEPLIDVTATARVEDYDITIGMNGTTSKLKPTFRSEPPLSEQDIFSLLAMGRTQQEQQIYSMQQQQAGVNSTADALLGGALNATVSSRVEKLFGGGSVRIDPTFVSGAGNSTARITVEQQVAKNATLTYATNINSTAEQSIQGQVNLTRDLSVLAVRDEFGVFSFILKIHRRYK